VLIQKKYSVDFPVFYESLDLNDPKYRVMAWDKNVAKRYSWHNFGPEWDLLKPEQETVLDFLYSLDIFVYRLGHTFRESWGRSTVEAMLSGCVPVVPWGHNFSEFIVQGVTGFMCKTFEDYRSACHELQKNPQMRSKMAKQASAYAASVVCKEDKHREVWRRVFNVG
jgi:glycosyltransferase involved in cell wall biosynthesis